MTAAVEPHDPHPVEVALHDNEDMLLQLGVDPARFRGHVAVALRENPALADTEPGSLLGAVLRIAQLRLEPGATLGHAWLIPFKDRSSPRPKTQFVLGYKGMITLAARAGITIHSGIVHEGDEFSWRLGDDPYVEHRPSAAAWGDGTHFWSTARSSTGARWVVVMSRAQADAWRKEFANPRSPAWRDHFDAMARKTTVRLVWAQLPTDIVSDEMRVAASADESTDDVAAAASRDAQARDDVEVVATHRALPDDLVADLAAARTAAGLDPDRTWEAWVAAHCSGAQSVDELDATAASALLDATRDRAQGAPS